jgi:hypothetical protein
MKRCKAGTFDGTERRQCTRPASAERDGIPVCRQHAKVPILRDRWAPRVDEAPRSADTILADFGTGLRFALYSTAGKVGRTERQDDADYLTGGYREAVGELATRTAFELQDAGLDDETIVDRLRAVVVAA